MIFTASDLKMKWGITGNSFYKRISYNIARNTLFRIQNGMFSDTPLEGITEQESMKVAARIVSPSYISFESVLAMSGVNYQYSSTFYVAIIGNTRDEIIDSIGISVRLQHLPKSIILNPIGVQHTPDYSIASKERAIADTIYRSGDFYFDILHDLDIGLLQKLAELYTPLSQRTGKKILSIINQYETKNYS